jgi:hypothetical protein
VVDYWYPASLYRDWVGQTTSTTWVSPTIVWNSWVIENSRVTYDLGTTGTNVVWNTWATDSLRNLYRPTINAPEVTRLRHEEYRARQEARQAAAALARTRSRDLLATFLSPEQQAELAQAQRFHVIGSKGRRYCIRAEGQAGNVDLVGDDGEHQASFCIHPGSPNDDSGATHYPDGDAWLTQMLAITTDEEEFLRTANVTRGSRPEALRVPLFAAAVQ